MKYKLDANNNVTNDEGATLPARWENGALVELDEHSPFIEELREWIAQGNTPEPADVPAHNDVINAKIAAIESARRITQRDQRELRLLLATQAGLPATWLDPAQPDPTLDPRWPAISYGVQQAVLQERAVRLLRGQRT